MADQIIIEFVGDTSKLEEAYNKVTEQVAQTSSLNKDSAASFQKANADIAASFDRVVDSNKQFNDQLRSLSTIVAGGVLKGVIADLNGMSKAQSDATVTAKELAKQLSGAKEEISRLAETQRLAGAGFEIATNSAKLFGLKTEDLEKSIVKLQTAMKVVNSLMEIQKVLSAEAAAATAAQTTATGAYGIALRIVEAIQEEFKVESATAWAIATGGISVLVTAVIGLGTVLYEMGQKAGETYRAIAKASYDAQKNTEEETVQVGLLVNEYGNVNITKSRQIEIIKELKTTSENYFGTLNNEKATIDDLTKAYNKWSQAIVLKAEIDLLAKRIAEEHIKVLDAEKDLANDSVHWYQVPLSLISPLQKVKIEMENYADAIKEDEKNTASYTKTINDLKQAMDKLGGDPNATKVQSSPTMTPIAPPKIDKPIPARINIQDIELKPVTLEEGMAKALGSGQLNQEFAAKFLGALGFKPENIAKVLIDSVNQAEKTATKEDTPEKLPTTIVDDSNKDAKANADQRDSERLDAMKKFNLSRMQIDDEYTRFQTETGETDYTKFVSWEQKKLDAHKATEKQIATASINFAKQASDQIFQTVNQNRNNRYNAEISTLQKQAAFELNNNNLTQAQKLAIQRKFDKEQAAVKLQQWKADQKSKEEQAIINGALAITNAFATAPWPLSIITAATAAATTAVQVATIVAQKPPQFAKGTPKGTPVTPAGTKLVGEHGPELIYTPGGERIITAPDTAAILAKYDVPALPNVSPAIAMRANLNHTHPLINEDTLAKKIALEISKQTKPHLTFDKNGFTAHLINRGSKTTILNNKYKL